MYMEAIALRKMSERQTKAGNQITLSLSQSLTLSFTHSRHTEQLLSSCLCSKLSSVKCQMLMLILGTR